MRKAVKYPDSKIITDNLKYVSGHSDKNEKIAQILKLEQKGFCAYTDVYMGRTDAQDIEHFNPKLKDTPKDNYDNWFLVKHQWNKEKSNKWDNYQPILHPTSDDFEKRVVYFEGDYFAKSDADVAAKHLIALLKLDDRELADERKAYIARKHEEIKSVGIDASTYFSTLIKDDVCRVSYLRAIKEEFGIDLWQMINK